MSYGSILQRLQQFEVEFILIGGLAATAHGSARVTYDVDVVYSRAADNLKRLAEALNLLDAYPRGAPPGLPFKLDQRTLNLGLNFTLTTQLGDLDLLGEVPGGGTYDNLLPHCEEINIFGLECKCVNLETLIHLKRAAGRPKDLESLAELEALLEEQNS